MVGDTSSADDVAAAFAKGTWRNNWSCVVFDEGCDTVFTHLILDKLWEGFIYVALKRAPICNLILSDLFVQQQPVNGSPWGRSMWARCSVHVDSCRFNQKGNRKRGIGIFNQFSYIYHRVLFWKGFPISMDKLLHQLVLVKTYENAAIISCMIFIMMGSSWIFYINRFLWDFAHPQQGLATSQLSDLPWAEAFEASLHPCGSRFFEFEEGKGHPKFPAKVQEVALQTATESQLQKYYRIWSI